MISRNRLPIWMLSTFSAHQGVERAHVLNRLGDGQHFGFVDVTHFFEQVRQLGGAGLFGRDAELLEDRDRLVQVRCKPVDSPLAASATGTAPSAGTAATGSADEFEVFLGHDNVAR